MALQQTLDALLKFEDYEVVPIDEYRVSYDTLTSFNYCFCRGVALKKGKLYGLAHIVPDEDPSPHINGMLHEMKDEIGDVKAIIVTGGDPGQIENCCKRKRIEVVCSYLGKKNPSGHFFDRDLIVVPSLDEVLIYTKYQEKVIKKF